MTGPLGGAAQRRCGVWKQAVKAPRRPNAQRRGSVGCLGCLHVAPSSISPSVGCTSLRITPVCDLPRGDGQRANLDDPQDVILDREVVLEDRGHDERVRGANLDAIFQPIPAGSGVRAALRTLPVGALRERGDPLPTTTSGAAAQQAST